MEGKLILAYWDIRGLAERIRLLLEYLGLSYEDKRYTVAEGDHFFTNVKPALLLKNPAITMPYLLDGPADNQQVISESDAIIIYLCHRAKRTDLLGHPSPADQVHLATVHGVFKDAYPTYARYVYSTYGEGPFHEALKKHRQFEASLKTYLTKLSGLLSKKDYFCSTMTWMDIVVADWINVLHIFDSHLLNGFDNLVALQKRVWALPKIKEYIESGRYKERPCNGPSAKWK